MSTFNYSGQYYCECGKQFTNSQSFNGHKCHCKVHLGEVKYEEQLQRQRVAQSAAVTSVLAIRADKRKKKEDVWQEREHYCERCGKLMDKKYGSGRFCSVSCAAKNHTSGPLSEEAKHHIAEAGKRLGIRFREEYLLSPKYCPICRNIIPYEKRMNKTCSQSCSIELNRRNQVELVAKGLHKGWLRRPLLSYAEQFWKRVLENNDIPVNHDYPVPVAGTHYLLDFFIEPNIDLEIDGSQHLLPESAEHDKVRDERLKQQGYLIYRIPYVNPREKELVEQQIDDFLAWLQSNK